MTDRTRRLFGNYRKDSAGAEQAPFGNYRKFQARTEAAGGRRHPYMEKERHVMNNNRHNTMVMVYFPYAALFSIFVVVAAALAGVDVAAVASVIRNLTGMF